jgi:small subunit ribosomal protein S17
MENKSKSMVARVVSNKMNKTVIVTVESRRAHPLYKKTLRRRINLKAHDEANSCEVGDLVRVAHSRPISKSKHWRVVEIVSKSKGAEGQVDDTAV